MYNAVSGRIQANACFNRTFMELKYFLGLHPLVYVRKSFNRTFMELKLRLASES